MAHKAQTSIEFRTTWVFLVIKLFLWLRMIRLIKILNSPIIGRTYINGKVSSEMRYNISNNQITLRIDSCGGEVKNGSDIKL